VNFRPSRYGKIALECGTLNTTFLAAFPITGIASAVKTHYEWEHE